MENRIETEEVEIKIAVDVVNNSGSSQVTVTIVHNNDEKLTDGQAMQLAALHLAEIFD